MKNDRPIEDVKMREAMEIVRDIFRYYDLAGAVFLVSKDEAAWGYALDATWNIVITDDETPLGFRIRVNEEDMGAERARELSTNTVSFIAQMIDFGTQTRVWFSDIFKLLQRQQGWNIKHIPFGGAKLPRLRGVNQ